MMCTYTFEKTENCFQVDSIQKQKKNNMVQLGGNLLIYCYNFVF